MGKKGFCCYTDIFLRFRQCQTTNQTKEMSGNVLPQKHTQYINPLLCKHSFISRWSDNLCTRFL